MVERTSRWARTTGGVFATPSLVARQQILPTTPRLPLASREKLCLAYFLSVTR
jgi:hypothetical protein